MLVQGVAGDEGRLGYFGFSYYEENQDTLKALQVENPKTGQCVAPSVATAQNNSYKPLSRPLFIYAKGSPFKRPEVQAFLAYIFATRRRSPPGRSSSRSRRHSSSARRRASSPPSSRPTRPSIISSDPRGAADAPPLAQEGLCVTHRPARYSPRRGGVEGLCRAAGASYPSAARRMRPPRSGSRRTNTISVPPGSRVSSSIPAPTRRGHRQRQDPGDEDVPGHPPAHGRQAADRAGAEHRAGDRLCGRDRQAEVRGRPEDRRARRLRGEPCGGSIFAIRVPIVG